jgi:hypothetical protein
MSIFDRPARIHLDFVRRTQAERDTEYARKIYAALQEIETREREEKRNADNPKPILSYLGE